MKAIKETCPRCGGDLFVDKTFDECYACGHVILKGLQEVQDENLKLQRLIYDCKG